MKYKKSKIAIGVLSIIGLITCVAMHKPSTFEAVSASGIMINCERGYITVPEVRDNPKSRKIKVEYVRLKSFKESNESPIFYLAGGPGNDATSQSENENYLEYWSPFLKSRDVVLIDQRGVGKLKLWWINLGWPPRDAFVSADIAIDHFVTMGKKAAAAFKRRGIDLNGYNSIESAHDIDTARDKLGYDKVIPFGFSYGTHLGQSYIKYHEDRVDKTILIGVEGLDHTYKMPSDLDAQLYKIADLVKADSSLNQKIPDFIDLYSRASNRLMANPIEIKITTPIKTTRSVRIGKYGLDYILKRDLGDAGDIPYFPRLLHSIAEGDGSALQWYVEKRFKELMGIPGMMVAMDLASNASSVRKTNILKEEKESMLGRVANAPFFELHEAIPVNDLGDTFRAPLQSEVPALLLSGSLDINTPAYQAEEVLKGLPNATHLIVENAGHEQIQFHWDMSETILDFINGKDVSDVDMAYPAIKFKSIK